MHTTLSNASLADKSEMLSIVPVITDRNPSAGKLKPKRALTWVEQMVKAAADVKPLITGVDMKLTINPEIRGTCQQLDELFIAYLHARYK